VVAQRYARRAWVCRRLLAASDCLAIVLSLALAGVLRGRTDLGAFLALGSLTLPGWLFLIRGYGLYDRDPKRINCSTIDDIPGIFHTVFIATVLLWGYFRILPVERFALAELLTFATSVGLLLLFGRALVRKQMSVRGRRRAVVVGLGPAANLLVRKLKAHPEYGLTVVGALRTASQSTVRAGNESGNGNGSAATVGSDAERIPVLGAAVDVERIAGAHGVDRVIVATQGVEDAALIDVLRRCKQAGLHVSVLPQIFDVMGRSVEIDDIEGVTVLGLAPPVLSRSSRAQKRAMDVVGSIVGLVLTAPLFAIVAVSIKLDSPGPIFFVQPRIGRDGRPLRIYKFRTMVRDAEAQRERLARLSEDPHWLKLDADPRVTRVGRLLRLRSLDELPQLLNVLKGEMSLVGPRPLVEYEDEQVVDWGRARLDLTPGMTGLWQVLGRTNIPFEEMVKLDYLYVTNWSLWSDVRLMLHTLPAVIHRRGAN
jgi:exopolysaccharide biosynthesis polyprenyl glycosylphosphotransferase